MIEVSFCASNFSSNSSRGKVAFRMSPKYMPDTAFSKRCLPGLSEITSTVLSTAVRNGGWKFPDSRLTGINPSTLCDGLNFLILSAGIKVAILVPVPTIRPIYAS